MTLEIEKVILRNLQFNETFSRKVIPFFKEEYFDNEDKLYFKTLQEYFLKYNKLPSKENISIELLNVRNVSDTIVKSTIDMAEAFEQESKLPENIDWLLEKAEGFCQHKALAIALMESVHIADGKNNQLQKTAIPDILIKALSVTFDTRLGHDYLEGFDERYDYYTRKVSKVKFHLPTFNLATDGGAERKTLNCVAAGTNVGKTIFLCDLAANYMREGLNVLYITLEMEEMKISQRVDANLMDVKIGEIAKTPRIIYNEKSQLVRSRCKGKLEVKEFPTGSSNSSHFRYFIKELEQKKNFKVDVIIIDNLNNCSSARIKNANDLYANGKSVAEEARGLAQEFNAVAWTGVQLNRSGNDNTDAGITNIGESKAVADTADFMFILILSDELKQNGQIMVKQVKSRYGDKDDPRYSKFIIGLDKSKMRFYELANPSVQPMNSPNIASQAIISGQNKLPPSTKKGITL